MKFTQVSEHEIKEKGLRASDVFETLNQFSNSGFRCVKLENYPHKTAASCAASFKTAVKRYKRNHIKVTIRGTDVYLINTLID